MFCWKLGSMASYFYPLLQQCPHRKDQELKKVSIKTLKKNSSTARNDGVSCKKSNQTLFTGSLRARPQKFTTSFSSTLFSRKSFWGVSPNVLLGEKAYFQATMVVGRRFSGVSTCCENFGGVSQQVSVVFEVHHGCLQVDYRIVGSIVFGFVSKMTMVFHRRIGNRMVKLSRTHIANLSILCVILLVIH